MILEGINMQPFEISLLLIFHLPFLDWLTINHLLLWRNLSQFNSAWQYFFAATLNFF